MMPGKQGPSLLARHFRPVSVACNPVILLELVGDFHALTRRDKGKYKTLGYQNTV